MLTQLKPGDIVVLRRTELSWDHDMINPTWNGRYGRIRGTITQAYGDRYEVRWDNGESNNGYADRHLEKYSPDVDRRKGDGLEPGDTVVLVRLDGGWPTGPDNPISNGSGTRITGKISDVYAKGNKDAYRVLWDNGRENDGYLARHLAKASPSPDQGVSELDF